MLRFLVQLGTGHPARYQFLIFIVSALALTASHGTPIEKAIAFTRILVISVTLLIVAVPEGLRLR